MIFTKSNVGSTGFINQTMDSNNRRDEALLFLRNVAKSATADAYHENVTLLKTSEVCLSNHHLQNWFEKRWLVEAKVQWT